MGNFYYRWHAHDFSCSLLKELDRLVETTKLYQ